MAYVTGSAATMAEVRTALMSACSINGWDVAGDIVYKGDVFVRLQVAGQYLTLLGGTGRSGSTLTGAAPALVRMGQPSTHASFPPITWPVVYEIFIHTDPDEVYLVINHSVDQYCWCAFGRSAVDGLPGTGGWFAATLYQAAANRVDPISMTPDGGNNYSSSSHVSPGLWWQRGITINAQAVTCYIHHGLDGGGWNADSPVVSAIAGCGNQLAALPNAWNSESVLVPVQVWAPRSSGNKVSLVADLAWCRYLRIDNHQPGEIIDIGGLTLKVYPWFRKNAAARNGGTNLDHTGTMGWAILYDGP